MFIQFESLGLKMYRHAPLLACQILPHGILYTIFSLHDVCLYWCLMIHNLHYAQSWIFNVNIVPS